MFCRSLCHRVHRVAHSSVRGVVLSLLIVRFFDEIADDGHD